MLSDVQELAMVALLGGETQVKAAEMAGCGYRSVCRWVAGHDGGLFRRELARRKQSLQQDARRMLLAEVGRSVRFLIEVRDDPNEDTGLRVKCAESVMDRAGIVKTSVVLDAMPDEVEVTDDAIGEWLASKQADSNAEAV